MFYTLVTNYAKYDLPITEAPGCIVLDYDLQTVFTKLFNIFYEFNVEAYMESPYITPRVTPSINPDVDPSVNHVNSGVNPSDKKEVTFHCKAFYNLKLLIYTISLYKYKDKISLKFENAGIMRGLYLYRLKTSINLTNSSTTSLTNTSLPNRDQHKFDTFIYLDLNDSVKYDTIKQSYIYLLNSDIKMFTPFLTNSVLRHIDKSLLELNCLIMTTLSFLLERKCIKLNYNILCHIYFTILLHKESTILHNIVFNMVHKNLQQELPQEFKNYLTNYRCKNGKNVQLVHKILKITKS